MAGVSIHDLDDNLEFGSRVDGVTWDNIHDEDLREQLRQLFVERGVLVFENMEPSSHMQVELSKVFGPLKDHPTKSTPRSDPDLAEGVIDMHRMPQTELKHDHGLVGARGKKLTAFLPWHFDHTYNDELNYAGVLRAVVSAPEEGRTGFADGIAIYRDMDPAIRAKIEDLSILYTLDVRLTQMRYGRYFETYGDTQDMAGNVEESTIFPRAIHPMTWTRPTGEKVAHFCGFSAVGVEGHEDPEGDAIFEEALQEMYRVIKPYWHTWRPTDMLIWDNHRILHAVEGCDPKYERRMHRTTIKGDYGLGRFEDGKKIGEVKRDVAPLLLPA
ncbi:MAG: TauD/TfdA family dioxygenase [Novosphingobium sp.]|nr:TauD/TfdA family dioxygenase [Novosphingobium sp.]